jgi:predicted ATPase
MIIEEIEISGYRSVKDIRMQLANVTVLVGANGCGKSNIYQALQLVAACAHGRFARQMMSEGGTSSVLWAGLEKKFEESRFSFAIHFDALVYELECGRIPISARPEEGALGVGLSIFRNDPDIKMEAVRFKQGKKTITLLERKRGSIMARNHEGVNVQYPGSVAQSESVISELRELHKFPELAVLRAELTNWRFYHEFRTDIRSPIREPQLATLTPIVSDNAHDLASALATIKAVGDREALEECVRLAFPGSELLIELEEDELAMYMSMPNIYRNISAREFSDGTLQYLCLLGALLAPRPGSLVVLNEPETSIHFDLFPSLAKLICTASAHSQIIVTTHAKELADLIRKQVRTHKVIELEKIEGATQVRASNF